VVTVAAAGTLHHDLVTVARVCGLLGSGAVVAALVHAHRPDRPLAALLLLLGALAFVLTGPVGAYTMAGLEHPLLVGLLSWGIVTAYPLTRVDRPTWRQLAPPATALGLMSVTRPDAPLLAAMVCAGLWLSRPGRARLFAALRLALGPAACLGALLLFRRLYYGDWVPNTYYAKVALTDERLSAGLAYVRGGLWPLAGLLVAALLALVVALRDREVRQRALLALLPMLGWSGYLVSIGGDNMPQHRHLVPVIALLALLAAELGGSVATRGPRLRWAGTLIGAALLAQICHGSFTDPERNKAIRSRWNWTGEPVGLFLGRAFAKQQPLVAVDAAGTLPYFAELPAIDMLGLCDWHIARHRPESFGRGKLAHELGDGAYVLGRKPDIVVFRTPLGQRRPAWLSGRQMVVRPDWIKHYRVVVFNVGDRTARYAEHWIRAEDGVLGVVREPDRIVVPGFLLGASKDAPAVLDASGRLGARASRAEAAVIRQLELPAGRWRAHVQATRAVRLTVRGAGGQPVGEGSDDLELTLDGSKVDLEVRARDARALVLSVSLTRS
jgi:hypothetical protein